MCLTNEHVGPNILAKIKIYILTRAELLFTLCPEIPCMYFRHVYQIRKLLACTSARMTLICTYMKINLFLNLKYVH